MELVGVVKHRPEYSVGRVTKVMVSIAANVRRREFLRLSGNVPGKKRKRRPGKDQPATFLKWESEMRAATVIIWLVCALVSYTAQIAHSNIDPFEDSLCRTVNSSVVCDSRLREEESFYAVWSIVGGPAALLV